MAYYLKSAQERSSIIFSLFVVFQLFNAFNSRELGNESIFKHLLKNKLMVVITVVTLILQIVIVQFCGVVFKTAPLSLAMWIKILACGFTVILVGEIWRFIKRRIKK